MPAVPVPAGLAPAHAATVRREHDVVVLGGGDAACRGHRAVLGAVEEPGRHAHDQLVPGASGQAGRNQEGLQNGPGLRHHPRARERHADEGDGAAAGAVQDGCADPSHRALLRRGLAHCAGLHVHADAAGEALHGAGPGQRRFLRFHPGRLQRTRRHRARPNGSIGAHAHGEHRAFRGAALLHPGGSHLAAEDAGLDHLRSHDVHGRVCARVYGHARAGLRGEQRPLRHLPAGNRAPRRDLGLPELHGAGFHRCVLGFQGQPDLLFGTWSDGHHRDACDQRVDGE
mmetsp:Transcript_170674/g.547457  ORF Transcript_170674/g.547457 Transcript_170674/m.547457 type:complete len:285 (-) Transcript_170674:1780-2634(-)